jgi:hypothetical protein
MGILVINMILPALAGLIWWLLNKRKLPVSGGRMPEKKH